MGCTARGGDSILNKKRLLALAVIGAALALSAVMVVSLKGDDKPQITNDQPSASEDQPASTPSQSGVYHTAPDDTIDKHHGPVAKPSDSTTDDNDNDNGNGNGNNGNGNGNDNGNGNGNGPSGTDGNQTKAHGLERAIEVHLQNAEKQDAKHGNDAASHDGKGLENSLEHLQMNLEKQTSQDVGSDQGNGHGQSNGNSVHA